MNSSEKNRFPLAAEQQSKTHSVVVVAVAVVVVVDYLMIKPRLLTFL